MAMVLKDRLCGVPQLSASPLPLREDFLFNAISGHFFSSVNWE
jgi:hypothetical protein